jgi:arylsulfatase A-like enzyme
MDSEVKLPLFLERLRRVRPRLAAVYCNATDMSQHFFGGADRPGDRPRPERNPEGRRVIEETYRVYDRLLGRVVNGVRGIEGYQNAVFVILSDHGIDLAADLEVRVAPPADDPNEAELILAEAAVVRPPGGESPWHRIHFDPGSAMGRRSALLNRLDQAGCRFHPDDVYLYFVHEEAPPGMVVVSGGPMVPGQTIDGMSVTDVAPTVLALLGLPAARDMAGRPANLIVAGVDGSPVNVADTASWVETHGAPGAPTSEQAIATPEDDEIREELRALGYIE